MNHSANFHIHAVRVCSVETTTEHVWALSCDKFLIWKLPQQYIPSYIPNADFFFLQGSEILGNLLSFLYLGSL